MNNGETSGCTKRQNKDGTRNGKKVQYTENSESRNSSSVSSFIWMIITPQLLNVIVPYLFFMETTSVGIYGLGFAIPYLFEDNAIYFQIVGCVMIFEIVINWCFIACTDSSHRGPHAEGGLDLSLFPGEVPSVVKNSTDLSPISENHHKLGVYPYWTWTPCYKCRLWRPPRCYHCALCKQCVLKRDHHCFFARTCIGFRNQKYFIVFCAWTLVSQIYALALALWYFWSAIWIHVTVFDLVPFASFLRYVIGYDHGFTGFLVLMGLGLMALALISFLQLMSALEIIFQSMTTFELDNEIDIIDDRSMSDRVQSVFGELWYMNFIIPLAGGRFSPNDDPFSWRHILPPKKKVLVRMCRMENLSYT